MNVLAIGDTHLPFENKHYLSFCKQTQKKYKCSLTVHVGDLVDNHAISYHEHDPDGYSPYHEMLQADKSLAKWFKAFPKLKLCKGNHDMLAKRKGRTNGIPNRIIKNFRDVWNLPKGWQFEWSYEINNVLYQHGDANSGLYPHAQACKNNRQSTVIGHCHSVAGVNWSANNKDMIFGLSTGCGIDRMKYAFWYGKDFKFKPILSCGVILENGRVPILVPMKI